MPADLWPHGLTVVQNNNGLEAANINSFLKNFSLLFMFWKKEHATYEIILLSVCLPLTLLGNSSVNAFPRQRIHMQQ
jgi:hypothetical protein